MTTETRHVTLCVSHPGNAGHLTLDHHLPAAVADELERRVDAGYAPGHGRYVTLLTSRDSATPLWVEVNDATAAGLVALVLPHMPRHVQDSIRVSGGDEDFKTSLARLKGEPDA